MAKPPTSNNAMIIMQGTFILGNILLLVMAILLDECSAPAHRHERNAPPPPHHHPYGAAYDQHVHNQPTSNDAHPPTGSHTVHRTATADNRHRHQQQTGGPAADDGGLHQHDGPLPVSEHQRRRSTAPLDAPGDEHPQTVQDGAADVNQLHHQNYYAPQQPQRPLRRNRKRVHGPAPDKPRNSMHYKTAAHQHFYDEGYNWGFQSMIPEMVLTMRNPAIRAYQVKAGEKAVRHSITYATEWVIRFHKYLKKQKLEKVNGVWNLEYVDEGLYSATTKLTLSEESETENPNNPNICCSTLVRIGPEDEENGVPATCEYPVCYTWVKNDVQFYGGLVGCKAPEVKNIKAITKKKFELCRDD